MKNVRQIEYSATEISTDIRVRLLHGVMRVRMIEEKIAELYPEQEMRCPVHLSIGQEAVAVGVCQALTSNDAVMSGHRAHAHYLAKGGDFKRMLAEIYGKETGCCKGRGGSMHLIDLSANFLGSTPIVGGTIPVATGVAWGYKLQNKNAVVVAFLGEGATEEGVWHESINFAVLHSLPILYVCENNLYSVYTTLSERQPQRKITDIAAAHGLRTMYGDGNNAQLVYEFTKEARDHALVNGPVFMEFDTYRWREHCGPNFDNDLGYRTSEEYELWKKKDPLEFLVREVVNEDILTEEDLLQMKKQLSEEIADTVVYAKESSFPKEKDLREANTYAPNEYVR